MLVVPKAHIATLGEVRAEHEPALGRMMGVAARVAAEQGSPDGFRMILNTGRVGRQEVMHMHAIVVLVILVVAEHSFGMWGLLLGVPICFFLYHHFIKGDDEEIARMPIRPRLRKQMVTDA